MKELIAPSVEFFTLLTALTVLFTSLMALLAVDNSFPIVLFIAEFAALFTSVLRLSKALLGALEILLIAELALFKVLFIPPIPEFILFKPELTAFNPEPALVKLFTPEVRLLTPEVRLFTFEEILLIPEVMLFKLLIPELTLFNPVLKLLIPELTLFNPVLKLFIPVLTFGKLVFNPGKLEFNVGKAVFGRRALPE